jgi:Ca2+/H+ antiporter
MCLLSRLTGNLGIKPHQSFVLVAAASAVGICGSLVLAVAVTVIEVALIVSVMVGGGVETAGLARDTVFAAVMIVCNRIVGLCLLGGGMRYREQVFQLQDAQAALSVIIALTTLTMVFPKADEKASHS